MTTRFHRALPAALCLALLVPALAQQDRWQQSIDSGLQAVSRGDLEAAEKHLQAAFDQAQSLSPAEISKSELYLGLLYDRQSHYEKAAGFYFRAAALREKAFGSDHPDVATALELEARVLRTLDNTVEADALADRATKIRRDALRAKSPKEPAPEVNRVRDGNVSAPRLISRQEPEYTEEARLFRHQGTVELSIEVWPDGRAHNIDIRRGLGLGLDEKAVEAVEQWRFQPGLKGGQPVVVGALVTVHFRLL